MDTPSFTSHRLDPPKRSDAGHGSSVEAAKTSLTDIGYAASMAKGGFRFTPQRKEVYDAVVEQRDHPTATEVFFRVKERLPSISLATVYNCLETLTSVGLVRQVSFERGPARFCSNLHSHAHFHCSSCGAVTDVPLPPDEELLSGWEVPEGALITDHEISIRGLCPQCASAPPRRR